MECPICKKEFDEKTGRRPKKFCSDACKVKFWNGKRTAKTTDVFTEAEVKDILKLANQKANEKGKWVIERKLEALGDSNNEETEKQIAAIKAEKIPENRNTIYGRKVWEIEQQTKIDNLKKVLK